MKYRSLIFDLDGTLVDSYPALLESLNFTLSTFGKSPVDLATIKKLVGRGLDNLMQQTIGMDRWQEAARVFRQSYDQTHERGSFLLPDVTQTLAALHHNGKRMCVASNKPADYSKNILKHLEYSPAFARECFARYSLRRHAHAAP